MFDFPDSVVISLNAGLPLGVETTFNLGEHGFESDYDAPDEGLTGGCSETQPPAALMLPERTVKAYVVRYTAYRTFVGDSVCNLSRSLMDEIQPTRDHLVYLYRRDRFLPQRFFRVPQRLGQVHLSVCRRGSHPIPVFFSAPRLRV